MHHYIGQALTGTTPSGGGGGLAEQSISGALSGAYSKKRYFVTGDCSVASGVDVSFEAGSVIEIEGDYLISVVGQIQLNGTSSERITVKPRSTNPNNRWFGFVLGIHDGMGGFSAGENATVHKFTYVDFLNAEKPDFYLNSGGAIFAYLYDSIEITNCTFTDCSSFLSGGAVYMEADTGATTTFNNCTFTNCEALAGAGGGWAVGSATASISGMTYVNCVAGAGVDAEYVATLATDIFEIADHGLVTGSICRFTAGSNAPTPLSAGTAYYAIYVSDNEFKLATSYANANAGTAINITALPSGDAIMTNLQEFLGAGSTLTITT